MKKDIVFESELLSGINHITEDGVEIKNYTLGQMYKEIKIHNYLDGVKVLNFNKQQYIDEGFSSEQVDYYIMCSTIELLEMFVICKEVKYHRELGDYIIYVTDDEFIPVNNEKLKNIFEILKEMYCIPDEKEDDKNDIIFQDDDVARRFAEFEDAIKNVEDNSEPKVTLNSLIEYVCSRHNSINLLNVWDLTMWQFYRKYMRLERIDVYDKTLNGIYAGIVDIKKINLEKIRADKVI